MEEDDFLVEEDDFLEEEDETVQVEEDFLTNHLTQDDQEDEDSEQKRVFEIDEDQGIVEEDSVY